MQAGLNYRSQGGSITVPYVTQSGFAEYKILPEILKRDWAGIGATVYQDKAGDGNLKVTHSALYASYHKGLDYDNNYFASFGASMGYGSKSVNYSTLLFDSQWDGYQYNPQIPSRETNSALSIHYWDFSAGSMFTWSPSYKYSVFAGTSLLHINNPKETYYQIANNQVGRKLTIHGGVEMQIYLNVYFQPQFLYIQKKKASESVTGFNLLFMRNDYRIYTGIWTRIKRDVIFLVGTEIKNISIYFSYDYNYSELSAISMNRGGFEISLIYQYDAPRKRKASPCKKTPFGVVMP